MIYIPISASEELKFGNSGNSEHIYDKNIRISKMELPDEPESLQIK